MDTDRYDRLVALAFNGMPLGDYPLEADRRSEEDKRFSEMQGLAWAVVGCKLDRAIANISFMSPPAPDCVVEFRDGSSVDLEIARIAFEDELQYRKTLIRILASSNELLQIRIDPYTIPGEYFFRFYDHGVPLPNQARKISEELVELVVSEISAMDPSTSFIKAGPAYPMLASLGVHVTRGDLEGPAHIATDGKPRPDFGKLLYDGFYRMLDKKKKLFPGYNTSRPVWLAFYVETPGSMTVGIVDELLGERIDPAPFDRVLVGSFTTGVAFVTAGEPPIYTSLTTDEQV